MTIQDKIYLAGFFDGEGCLSIIIENRKERPNPSFKPQVIFANTCKEMMIWIYALLKEELDLSINPEAEKFKTQIASVAAEIAPELGVKPTKFIDSLFSWIKYYHVCKAITNIRLFQFIFCLCTSFLLFFR